MRRSGKARRWGLFVEGAHWLVPQRRDELVELWHELVQACSKLSKDLVSVHGFNKGQLVAMGEPRDPLTRSLARTSTEIPLDVMIATAYDQQPAQRLAAVPAQAQEAQRHVGEGVPYGHSASPFAWRIPREPSCLGAGDPP